MILPDVKSSAFNPYWFLIKTTDWEEALVSGDTVFNVRACCISNVWKTAMLQWLLFKQL